MHWGNCKTLGDRCEYHQTKHVVLESSCAPRKPASHLSTGALSLSPTSADYSINSLHSSRVKSIVPSATYPTTYSLNHHESGPHSWHIKAIFANPCQLRLSYQHLQFGPWFLFGWEMEFLVFLFLPWVGELINSQFIFSIGIDCMLAWFQYLPWWYFSIDAILGSLFGSWILF